MSIWWFFVLAFVCFALFFAMRTGLIVTAWAACKRWPAIPFLLGVLVAYFLFSRPGETTLR
jgi:hypothetical protein